MCCAQTHKSAGLRAMLSALSNVRTRCSAKALLCESTKRTLSPNGIAKDVSKLSLSQAIAPLGLASYQYLWDRLGPDLTLSHVTPATRAFRTQRRTHRVFRKRHAGRDFGDKQDDLHFREKRERKKQAVRGPARDPALARRRRPFDSMCDST